MSVRQFLRPWSAAILAFSATTTCTWHGSQKHTLRTDAGTACDRHTAHWVLQLPATGGFFLNTQSLDSSRLASYIHDWLPRMPTNRLFMVRADSTRARDLDWILSAVEHVQRSAYVLDTSCLMKFPDVT